jgi:CRISPR-associated protein Cmr4
LHTGGASQEGNLLGIARESHTDLPYIPSSTIRGRLRASFSDAIAERVQQVKLFGPELKRDLDDKTFLENYQQKTGKSLTQLEQGDIWIGDGSILWLPVPSLSHSVIWVSCPLLLHRWARLNKITAAIPQDYSFYLGNQAAGQAVYLKDAILKASELHPWNDWQTFVPQSSHTKGIQRLLVLPDQHCATLIQMSLWRQVRVKLDEYKTVEGGSFRYEEAIPPDTLMYFPWGLTSQANGSANTSQADFASLLTKSEILQIGGQESLGRGFVQQWTSQ